MTHNTLDHIANTNPYLLWTNTQRWLRNTRITATITALTLTTAIWTGHTRWWLATAFFALAALVNLGMAMGNTQALAKAGVTMPVPPPDTPDPYSPQALTHHSNDIRAFLDAQTDSPQVLPDRSPDAPLDPTQSTDAVLWATDFVTAYHQTLGRLDKDELAGLMIGWFANAIETGRRDGRQGARLEAQAMIADRIGEMTNLTDEQRDAVDWAEREAEAWSTAGTSGTAYYKPSSELADGARFLRVLIGMPR